MKSHILKWIDSCVTIRQLVTCIKFANRYCKSVSEWNEISDYVKYKQKLIALK